MKEIKKHSFLLPRADKYRFDEFTDSELRGIKSELTEREKKDFDSKYIQIVPAPIGEEHKIALEGGPIAVSDAFEFEEYGRMMNRQGYCKVENGYCVLPSGVTYAAAMILQQGRTDEMIDYYNQNFGLTDSLFYKIWFPGNHYLHFCDGGCLEDFGFGRLKMKFTAQLDAKDLGIHYEDILVNDPDCIYIGGTAAIGRNLDSDDPDKEEANIILFYHRKTDYGREVRIRLYYGIGWRDGKIIYTIPEADRAEEIARKTLDHIIHEYTNDELLETTVYADYKAGRR